MFKNLFRALPRVLSDVKPQIIRTTCALYDFKRLNGEQLAFEPLPKFLKKNADLSLAENYKIIIHSSNHQGSSSEHCFYFDTHLGLILTWSDKKERVQLGCLGFDINDKNAQIIIKQIQGPTYDQKKANEERILELLKVIKWERLLVAAISNWAVNNKFASIALQPAVNNRWFSEERKAQLYMRYDVTARRSGFVFDKNKSLYIKKFSSVAEA